jgi:NhaA family Na+:H+ antiporter
MQRLGVRTKLAYVVPATVAWAGIYSAGIHPTIAGVIVGLMTPVRAWLGPDGLVMGVREELDQLALRDPATLSSHQLAETLRYVDVARREAMSPAESLIETLHPWVAYAIMPVFALANAGVSVSGGSLDATSRQVGTAVVVGLVVGKPVGVLIAGSLMLRLRLGTLPAGMTLRHLAVLGVVAGVGFTMALFIAPLALTDALLLSAAKLGVLVASGCAGTLALVLGRLLLPAPAMVPAATADEVECSAVA